MDYEINPCIACKKKYQSTGNQVTDINNCCYETLAAFSGNISESELSGTKGAQICRDCVYEALKNSGRVRNTPCSVKISPPPIFAQHPHFLPGLLKEKGNLEHAYQTCVEMCKEQPYPGTCIENCQVDRDAVILKKAPLAAAAPEPEKKDNNMLACFGVAGLILLLIFIVLIALYRKE